MSHVRRSLLRLLSFFRSDRAEAELAREIQAHLQMLEDGFVAQGMNAENARRAARRAFGGVEQTKERQRDARSFRSLDYGWLDLKLGARMLVRYPGLTLVGVLGMAVAIAMAAGAFSMAAMLLDPVLPIDEGDRVVVLLNRDRATNRSEPRILHDFVTWRAELNAVQDVGAFRTLGRNLIADGRQPEMVRVTEMSAAGFRVARVPPLLGRHLIEHDEREEAPPVVVIGYDVWRNRFAGDAAIVGRPMLLGDTAHTIVGVMPQGFAFPVRDNIWVPLRTNASQYQRRQGPALTVFARLAPGETIESAQVELTIVGGRTAAAFPQTHEHLSPRVFPYPHPFSDMDDPESRLALHVTRFLVTLLLSVVCVNVAILVYARTATREGEIAMRTALGATRRRIVTQLFIEALVLSATAAMLGLAILTVALQQVDAALVQMGVPLPFWMQFDVSWTTLVYVAIFTVLGAAIVGVLPALKATGRRLQSGLQPLSAGGGARVRLGRTWTVLIVAQVAFAVALLPGAVFNAWASLRAGAADLGIPAEEFLTANLVLDRGSAPRTPDAGAAREFTARFAARQAELMARLRSDAAVSAATFGLALPGGEGTVWIEAEGVPMPAEPGDYSLGAGTNVGHMVWFNRVDAGFFSAFDVPVVAGRGFLAGDASPGASAIIVNQAFARRILGDRDVIGRQIRYVGRGGDTRADAVELGRWYEIVGVVGDFPSKLLQPGLSDAKLYHAAVPGQFHPAAVAVRVRGAGPGEFAGRLREITAAVDGNLQLRNLARLDEVLRAEQRMMRLVAAVLAILTVSVVLLSSAGIYALMSVTVSQRRKEIGIRAALGADPRRLITGIFSRALRQLAAGAALGVMAAAGIEGLTGGELMRGNGAVVLPIVVVVMLTVGLLAALGPARRGLRIDPTEALREQ